MHGRDLLDIDTNKKKIVAFIQAAAEGKYYRPMDAVGRMATIAAAAKSLGEDSLLSALVQEVRDLRGSLNAVVRSPRPRIQWDSTLFVKTLLTSKHLRKLLYEFLLSIGGTPAQWSRVVKARVSVDFASATERWSEEEWKEYVRKRYLELPKKSNASSEAPTHAAEPRKPMNEIDEELVERVRNALPPQPWPKGTHKVIIATLSIAPRQYKQAIAELIERGIVHQQVDDVLLDVED